MSASTNPSPDPSPDPSPASNLSATPSAGPNPNSDPIRKRARPIQSCLECRRKKLKCDRTQPCMQCKKLGRDALCTYANGPPRVVRSIKTTGERELKRPKFNVLPSIERQPEIGATKSQQDWARNHASRTGPQPTIAGRLRVKDGQSRYVGLGDRMALLNHFKDEKGFILSTSTDPSMAAWLSEMSTFQKAFHPKFKASGRSSEERVTMAREMVNALPESDILYTFKERYLNDIETVLRVFHVPSFQKKCAEAQEAQKSQSIERLLEMPLQATIAQLLCVVSIATRSNNSDDKHLKARKLSEQQVAANLTLVQRWLDGLKGKEHLNLDALRTQTLLLIARLVNIVPLSELWKDSGVLVRSAMTIGLHRDPEYHPELSPFAKEQRRRLWQTIVELDLQFSLALSMPTAIQPSDYNSKEILHVNDEQLEEHMTAYPKQKPREEWSDALPQILLGSMMKHRLEATNLLAREIDLSRDIERILTLAEELEDGVRSLQASLPKQSKRNGRVFSDIVLDVHLRRTSLALYQTVALSDQASYYPEARKGALQSAAQILSHLDALDPAVADLDTIQSNGYLNFYHVLFKNDIIQSALLLCYEIRAFNQQPDHQPALSDNALEGWTKHGLTRIVENTLRSLIERLGEFGSDLKVVLPLSVVLQSVRADGTPESKRELMIKGTERVFQACRRAIPLPSNNDTALKSLNAGDVEMPQTPLPDGQAWSMQIGPISLPFQGGLPQPTTGNNNNFNPIVNGVGAFPDFDLGFSDWDFIGQTWS